MQLMGEVPSKNVPKVIQAVSKWMFNKKLTSSDLPCPSSPVNMTDRAQVLSKYQVAEEICGEENHVTHGASRIQHVIDSYRTSPFTASLVWIRKSPTIHRCVEDCYNSERQYLFIFTTTF